jgi:hypothetical protein
MEEWLRAELANQDRERDRRNQEITAEANRQNWMYWNDPVSGFWAIIRRQDEAFALQQEANRLSSMEQDLSFVTEDPVGQAAGFNEQLGGQRPHDDWGSEQQLQSWNDALRQTPPEPGRETPRQDPGDTPDHAPPMPEPLTIQPERPLDSDAGRRRYEPGSEQLIQLINEALSTTDRDDRGVRDDFQQRYDQGSEGPVQSAQEAPGSTAYLEEAREDGARRGADEREWQDAEVTRQVDYATRTDFEVNRQIVEAQLRNMEAKEQGLWWQRFYKQMDDQALQAQERAREWTQEFLRRQAQHRLEQSGSAYEPTWEPPSRHSGVDAAQLAEYVNAFHGRFADHPALHELWREASQGAGSFGEARARFWQEVNQGDSTAADFVKAMLKEAGYEPQTGSNAPLLSMPEFVTSQASEGRRHADLLLSIDHADPMTNPGTNQRLALAEALDPGNLRFMPGRDNSSRGNRYTEDDRPWPE